MKRISLTIITANKADIASAEPVKNEILQLLGNNSQCVTFEKYDKIPNCYKAVFEIYLDVQSEQDFNYNLLTLSSSIARPWMIYFQNNFGTELIFNKSEATSYNRNSLNTIIWAHVQHAG